jgi:hypothetical protein
MLPSSLIAATFTPRTPFEGLLGEQVRDLGARRQRL